MKEFYKTPRLEVLYETLQDALLDASGDVEREDYPSGGDPFNW